MTTFTPSLVFASANPNKVQEIAALLPPEVILKGLHDIGCTQDIPETQPTIEGNALQKARYIHTNYQVNCFADDTGLEVQALDNRPGVLSARYAGPQKLAADNIQKVLHELQNNPNRKARFKTVIALIYQNQEYIFQGIINGSISQSPLGTSGFGYDPIFIPEGQPLTFSQMTLEQKNKISHRAIATQALVQFINNKMLK